MLIDDSRIDDLTAKELLNTIVDHFSLVKINIITVTTGCLKQEGLCEQNSISFTNKFPLFQVECDRNYLYLYGLTVFKQIE